MGVAGSKKLPKEDMQFLIENTNFTKQQIKAWYKGFMVCIASSTRTSNVNLIVRLMMLQQRQAAKFCYSINQCKLDLQGVCTTEVE